MRSECCPGGSEQLCQVCCREAQLHNDGQLTGGVSDVEVISDYDKDLLVSR